MWGRLEGALDVVEIGEAKVTSPLRRLVSGRWGGVAVEKIDAETGLVLLGAQSEQHNKVE